MRRAFSVPRWTLVFGLVVSIFSLSSEVRAQPALVFGLTNVPLGQAILMRNVVTNLGPAGVDGMSILLGEADAGVFVYPATLDNPQQDDYMLGRAYGRLNGLADQLLCTVRARKVALGGGDGIYPVSVDFTPLGATHLTAEVYSRGAFVEGRTNAPAETVVHSEFNGYHIKRVNPFWRTAEGGIAAVFDFDGDNGFDIGPLEPDHYYPFGNRLVIRAMNPTGVVDFVSRVDITSGSLAAGPDDEEMELHDGLSTFQMDEVRLGVFGRAHKALGPVILEAAAGRLRIVRAPLAPEFEDYDGNGVAVELSRASKAQLNLLPLELGTNGSLTLSALATAVSPYYWTFPAQFLGAITVTAGETNTLEVMGTFPAIGFTTSRVQVAVYRQGSLVGTTPASEAAVLGHVVVAGSPRVVAAGGMGLRVDSFPGLYVKFDAPALCTVTNDSGTFAFTGDEVRLLVPDPVHPDFPLVEATVETLNLFSLTWSDLSEVTISSEEEERVTLPALNFARTGAELQLSWVDPNQVYFLNATSDLNARLEYRGEIVTQIDSNYVRTAVLTIETNINQFFRLGRGSPLE